MANIKANIKTEIIKDENAKVIEIPMAVWKKLKEQARKEAEDEFKQDNLYRDTSDR